MYRWQPHSLWSLLRGRVKNSFRLQHSSQRPSTNNSAGAKEPLQPGKQATSPNTHTQWDVGLGDGTSYRNPIRSILHLVVWLRNVNRGCMYIKLVWITEYIYRLMLQIHLCSCITHLSYFIFHIFHQHALGIDVFLGSSVKENLEKTVSGNYFDVCHWLLKHIREERWH